MHVHVTGYLSSLICTSLDINECAIANGECEHECINTEGSFYCDCRGGHMLESNNHTCEGNENFESWNDCVHVLHWCGWSISNNISTIPINIDTTDIPECTTGRHNCTGNAICVEAVGYFTCVCPANYRIDEDTYASCKGIHHPNISVCLCISHY